MVSFGASRHFLIKPLQSLVNETKQKPMYDPPNALYTMCVPGMSTGAYRKDMQISQREQSVEGNICPQDAWKSRSP